MLPLSLCPCPCPCLCLCMCLIVCVDVCWRVCVGVCVLLLPPQLPKPVDMEIFTPVFNKGQLGRALRKDQKPAVAFIEEMCQEDDAAARAFAAKLEAEGSAVINVQGKELTITSAMVSFKTCVAGEGGLSHCLCCRCCWHFVAATIRLCCCMECVFRHSHCAPGNVACSVTKRVAVIKYVPSVIEPSFGVGRILAAIFEHSYSYRGKDKSRGACVPSSAFFFFPAEQLATP